MKTNKYIKRYLYQVSHLQISVNQPVHLEIIVVFTEWIDENLRHFEPGQSQNRGLSLGNIGIFLLPAHIEEKL